MTDSTLTSARAIVQQALQASAVDDTTRAVALFEEAIRLEPSDALPHYLLGVELASAGQVDNAEAAIARALLLDPSLQMARFQLGLLQYTSGRLAIAMMTWQPLASGEDSYLQRFVTGFALMAQGDVAGAIASVEAGIAMNDENAPLNGDMHGVIQRLRSLPPTTPGSDEAATSVDSGDQHVLLAGYQRTGGLH